MEGLGCRGRHCSVEGVTGATDRPPTTAHGGGRGGGRREEEEEGGDLWYRPVWREGGGVGPAHRRHSFGPPYFVRLALRKFHRVSVVTGSPLL